jgi:hypothetical protein
LTQVISNPTDQRLADGTQTTPGALTDVINAAPNAVPLDMVTVNGTQYPSADQAVEDALNQYSQDQSNVAPLDKVTVTGKAIPAETSPADTTPSDTVPSTSYTNDLGQVVVHANTDTPSPLSDLVPTDVNAPPTVVPVTTEPPVTETPPVTTTPPVVPTVPTVPTIPTIPKKPATVAPKTVAPLPQQKANHLPGVDTSFLTRGTIIDENSMMPMAQALVDQSNGSLTLPEALAMVKQNQPKGKK